MYRADKSQVKGGYRKISVALNRVLDIMLALFFLIAGLPVFLLLAAAVKLQDRGPVFYASKRLGKDKVPFDMFKFRTMITNADEAIGKNILSSNRSFITPLGRFLRDTRLDELPQLFNILAGDMTFVGPRPLPPILYETDCKYIRGYDKRFIIRPGLIGYSQLFTPHSSPNRIRSKIDNRLIVIAQNFFWDFFIVFFTLFTVARRIVFGSIKIAWRTLFRIFVLPAGAERRRQERVRARSASAFFARDDIFDLASQKASRVMDLNEEYILVFSDENLPEKNFTFKIQTTRSNRRRREIVKTAYCTGKVFRKADSADGFRHRYVLQYAPASPFNHYVVHQYFLGESLA